MNSLFRDTAFALAAVGMAASVPAAARDHGHDRSEQSWQVNHRDRYGYDTRYYGRDYHSQPGYRTVQAWRGNDGRYYCRRNDGTTGMLVGAAAGALLGNAIDGGYDHPLGTVIGGALGALAGKSVAQGGTCR